MCTDNMKALLSYSKQTEFVTGSQRPIKPKICFQKPLYWIRSDDRFEVLRKLCTEDLLALGGYRGLTIFGGWMM